MILVFHKLNLTAHIVSSIGFLGAVASFLVLSIAGLTSPDAETVRGAYLAMNLIGQVIIVPLSLVALLTGIIQSLGTEWGLFRYYWLSVKFILTIVTILLLMLHQFTAVTRAAKLAGEALPNVGRLGTQLVGDASLGLLVLLMITGLSMYKPWGLTRYGRKVKMRQQPDREIPLGLKMFLVVIGILAATGLVLAHLSGHYGFHGHDY